MPGLLGEKLGMMQIFSEGGQWVPVTVVRAGPCTIIQKKQPAKEGYSAVQLGYFEQKEKRSTKAEIKHCTSKGQKVYRFLKEFRTNRLDVYQPGDQLTVSLFQKGDVVDVSGVSKGKGFQGVMKRHHFAGGRASHGCSLSHRSAGSIGQRTYPGKVFKGKRMAGQMGNERVTMKNLDVVGIENEQNLLLIKGAIPGANHSIVVITPKSNQFEQRIPNRGEKADEGKAL